MFKALLSIKQDNIVVKKNLTFFYVKEKRKKRHRFLSWIRILPYWYILDEIGSLIIDYILTNIKFFM